MLSRLFLKLTNLNIALRVRLYPTFNRWKLSCNGVKYGCNALIYSRLRVFGGGKIRLGDNFMLTSGDGINPISSNLEACFLVESGATVTIGDDVGMSSTRLWIADSLTIGNHVKVGAGVLIIDTDTHPIDYRLRRTTNDGTLHAPISIGDDVWIGAQSIILKGVTIGPRSIIGAGSVVTRDIPADCIAAGNPARVIRQIGQQQ